MPTGNPIKDALHSDLADPDFDTRRQIAMRLIIMSRMMRSNFDRKVARLNVTRSQWAMIMIVSRHPGSTQRTIAEALEMSEASAGRLIDRLCMDGLLERRARPDDRRARAVYLTDAAGPLLAQLTDIATESDQRLMKGFSDEELSRLRGYIDRIYDNICRG